MTDSRETAFLLAFRTNSRFLRIGHNVTGTTVLGAFDPIAEIADVCHEYGVWLHVDAAWGGGALVSKKHKHLLTGIHR